MEEKNVNAAKVWGLSGSTLKWIAIITMLIDHIGASVLFRMYIAGCESISMTRTLYIVYRGFRQVGRIAFPIFCFLLVEGFIHTSDLRKYMSRLAVFALLSEIPFDLAFFGKISFIHQNVFFTLLIGLAAIASMDFIEKRTFAKEKNTQDESLKGFDAAGRFLAGAVGIAAILLAGMWLGRFLWTDYDAKGVLAICVMYLFRKSKPLQMAAGCLSFVYFEPAAILAFIPIGLYNKTRGRQNKYFFYLFYPLHLFALYLACIALGLSGITF